MGWFGGNLVIFDARMKVGFLAASRYGRKTSSFAFAVWGVVVKTLRLDRDDRGLQYGHVYPPVLSPEEREATRLLGVDGVVSHPARAATTHRRLFLTTRRIPSVGRQERRRRQLGSPPKTTLR